MGKVYVGPKNYAESIEETSNINLDVVAEPNTIVQEKIVERIVEVPVDREVIVERIVEVPVDREVVVEKIVEVPIDREVIVEKPVIVEKIVEIPVEKVIEVRDFSKQKTLQDEINRLKLRNRLSLAALVVLIILNMLPR